ncbi:MAG: hypothetical protein ACOVKC_10195 [Brevundimonas sp.]
MGVTIYKRDSAGRLREWRMEVEGDKYRTIAGLAGGNQAVSDWTVATPKNVGRANETSAWEQAIAELNAGYEAKLKREYFRTIEETDTPRFFKPMLAQGYDGKVAFPVYSQPKLDGIRAIASKSGLASREGQPILSCPHIVEALAPFFDACPEAILDGEIYNHALHDDFNEIVSIVKRDKCSPEQLAKSAALAQYHVYDFPSVGDMPFGQRTGFGVAAKLDQIAPCIVMVATERADHQVMLDAFYADYLEYGYEGQMVRLDAPYEQKRSKTLLKRKEFQDNEYPIVEISEGLGNWAGVAKRVTCTLPDGRTFGAGIRGTKERAKVLLTETWETATVRYFALTPDGIPRFPVVTAFHNGVRL